MDPIGQWYVSYNHLIPANSGTIPANPLNTLNTEIVSQHVTTDLGHTAYSHMQQPLIVQTSRPNAVAMTQTNSFASSSFLPNSAVNYDVFTPVIQHTSSKQLDYLPQNYSSSTQAPYFGNAKSILPSDIQLLSSSNAVKKSSLQTKETDIITETTNTASHHWTQGGIMHFQSPFGVLPHEDSTPFSTSDSFVECESPTNRRNDVRTIHHSVNSKLSSVISSKPYFQAPFTNKGSKPVLDSHYLQSDCQNLHGGNYDCTKIACCNGKQDMLWNDEVSPGRGHSAVNSSCEFLEGFGVNKPIISSNRNNIENNRNFHLASENHVLNRDDKSNCKINNEIKNSKLEPNAQTFQKYGKKSITKFDVVHTVKSSRDPWEIHYLTKKRKTFEKYSQDLLANDETLLKHNVTKTPIAADGSEVDQQNDYYSPRLSQVNYCGSNFFSHGLPQSNKTNVISSPSCYFSNFNGPIVNTVENSELKTGLASVQKLKYTTCNNEQLKNFNQIENLYNVIVPNIEEELKYLDGELATLKNVLKSPDTKINSGFMNSFLKFVQGEKDNYPTQLDNSKKPFNWKKLYIPPEGAKLNSKRISSSYSKDISNKDYQNDPRYFPLPKERKKHNSESSDGAESSSQEEILHTNKKKSRKPENTTLISSIKTVEDTNHIKKSKIKSHTFTPFKHNLASKANKEHNIESQKITDDKIQTKDSWLIKGKSSMVKEINSGNQNCSQDCRITSTHRHHLNSDSDSDPSWEPDNDIKKTAIESNLRSKKSLNRKSKRDSIFKSRSKTTADSIENLMTHTNSRTLLELDNNFSSSTKEEVLDISPFKPGEFIVIKADLNQEFPPLWRIDGSTLLQKYEPFQSNGKMLYRNVSTYSGWSPQNRHIYRQVSVKFWQQGKVETIIEFLKEEILEKNRKPICSLIEDYEKYQDNFEVYIQTLISQALDSNFLSEIFQEKDDYFLSNIKIVDDFTNNKKEKLATKTKWKKNILTALCTWPSISKETDLINYDLKNSNCAGCQNKSIRFKLFLHGKPYDSMTLQILLPALQRTEQKVFFFCQMCLKKVVLFNKIAHQKYNMFIECSRRVAEKRRNNSNKDTTVILNELLADESWLNQLFRNARLIWAEIDHLETGKLDIDNIG